MIRWDITHLTDAAQVRADAMPEYRRSMRGAAGNEVGALGELLAIEYLTTLGIPVEDTGTVDCDLTTPFGTIDVKTKERTVRPQAHYDCTVPDYVRDHQRPDWYLFVSLVGRPGQGVGRFTEGWLLGTISAGEFDRLAVRWEPGRKDGNGWEATVTCCNVKVACLRPPQIPVQSAM
jgi:hypothetical protein